MPVTAGLVFSELEHGCSLGGWGGGLNTGKHHKGRDEELIFPAPFQRVIFLRQKLHEKANETD